MSVVEISVVETAKLLREALRATFPGACFSVRSYRFGGGTEIEVSWEDGPAEWRVHALTSRYRGTECDELNGAVTWPSTLVADRDGDVREVHFGADRVTTRRRLSPHFLAARAAQARPFGRAGESGVEVCGSCSGRIHPEAAVWLFTADMARADSSALVACAPLCGARTVAQTMDALA